MNPTNIPESSHEARSILEANFACHQGHIVTKVPGYKPTEMEWMAVSYLCDEFDFTCDINVG